MNNSQAIEKLNSYLRIHKNYLSDSEKEAFTMAIEALIEDNTGYARA